MITDYQTVITSVNRMVFKGLLNELQFLQDSIVASAGVFPDREPPDIEVYLFLEVTGGEPAWTLRPGSQSEETLRDKIYTAALIQVSTDIEDTLRDLIDGCLHHLKERCNESPQR